MGKWGYFTLLKKGAPQLHGKTGWGLTLLVVGNDAVVGIPKLA